MTTQQMRTLADLDRKIDSDLESMGATEIDTYRKLMIRYVEDASRAGCVQEGARDAVPCGRRLDGTATLGMAASAPAGSCAVGPALWGRGWCPPPPAENTPAGTGPRGRR
jgi:hypothetical protein